MNYITVLLVSIALGIDAFSVAVSIGLGGANKRQMLTVIAIVTFFHVLMPLLGLYLGTYMGRIAGPMASSIGALVLIAIGLSVIWKSLKDKGNTNSPLGSMLSINSPLNLVLVGASVSLDALTVGFGLGTLKVDLILTVITMGIVAGLMTLIGLVFGKRLTRTFGEKAEILGGLILVVIGIKLLFV
jgi:putative Mn2+ efflux pump MntP